MFATFTLIIIIVVGMAFFFHFSESFWVIMGGGLKGMFNLVFFY